MKGIAKVAKIDASVNRQFDQTYGLKGYPHIVLIPAGIKLSQFRSKRQSYLLFS